MQRRTPYHVYADDGFETAHSTARAAQVAARRGSRNRRMTYIVVRVSSRGCSGADDGITLATFKNGRQVTTPKPTIVVFRTYRDGSGTIALMPDEPFDVAGRLVTSYMHVGQHAGADYQGVISQTRPATSEECLPLLRELQSIGYNVAAEGRKPNRRTTK